MSDGAINAGKYLGGWTGDFNVKADKNALKGAQKTTDAVNSAKSTNGAEVTVIDSAGNAAVHSLSVENGTFSHPKATPSGLITIDNLTTGAKPDKNKPLAIDPGIAGMFGGTAAILTDEKNNVSVIGNKTEAINNFLVNPTVNKVDAAYNLAGDDNSVSKKMATNVTNKLTANYRDTGSATHDIGLLKEGQAKTNVNTLIADLNVISANTQGLETQRKDRDNKFGTDIAKPQDRLNKDNDSWDSSSTNEANKVNNASENLREAKYPGVHETESTLEKSKNMLNNSKGYLEGAAKEVTEANSNVNHLENLKQTTTNLSNRTQDLKMNNNNIVLDMANYLVNRKDQLSTLKATLNDKAQYFQNIADTEDRKPVAPSTPPSGTTGGSSNSADPFAKPSGSTPTSGSNSADPFAKPSSGTKPSSNSADPFAKPSSGNKPSSNSSDPFSNGGGSKPSSNSSDPFSNNTSGVQYKNSNTVNEYRRKANETRSDANSIDMRSQSINKVIREVRAGGMDSYNFRQAVESMPNNNSYSSSGYALESRDSGYNYLNGENSDKAVILNNYVAPYNDNKSTIERNTQVIRSNVSQYENNIDSANQRLQQAKVNESQASGNLSGAQSTVTQVSNDLERIKSRPALDDGNVGVKSAKSALNNAQNHQDNTVGDDAPLTKEKNTAQTVVNDITNSHTNDVKEINSKINDNANSAQQKINATKKNLGI
ncbi:MAG: hypothetical protein H7263_06670 [Candidatus Sericytochromatia bacterium]|nr:hypothetical protein [Candidatus Sericytochromatia bacterium]